MIKRLAFITVLLVVAIVGLRQAWSKPWPDRRPAIPYDGEGCPPGYTKGIAALRPSSRENPLRLDQPEGNWMYVCAPIRTPWSR